VQQRFVHNDSETGHQILLFALMVVCIIALMWMIARIQQARSRPARAQPMNLYLRLQRRLHLPLWTRFRLWRLARQLNIEHPAALLISEQLFDEAVERYRISGRASTSTQTAFAGVRAQLFPHR
jgi:hypothetical protein